MEAAHKPAAWKVLAAFAVIYLVWGSTFLAIRITVRDIPPFLCAAVRFFAAGILFYAWLRLKGDASPSRREWRSIALLAILIFVFDYGLVFWAEQRVPSGLTAVLLAMIPAFMAILEILILKTRRMTASLALALFIGTAGVAVLVNRSASFGQEPVSFAGAVALTVAGFSWALASILTRKLPLPSSKSMSAAAQMLLGGALLTLTSATLGEFRGFHLSAVSIASWLALAYQIFAGSILAFTAYIWLLHHQSPTKVGTYAYVNPVIAVLIGYFFASEPLGPRTIAGTALVLLSVIVISTTQSKKVPAPVAKLEEVSA